MAQTFAIQLGKSANSPKNWLGKLQRQINGNYALVTKGNDPNLWDLNTLKTIPGTWTSLHPHENIGLQWIKENNEDRLTLRNITNEEILTNFEDKVGLQFDPYGPFASYALSQNYDSQKDNLRAGQKRSLPIYSTKTGKRLYTLETPFVVGTFLANQKIALVDGVGKISIYDLETGELITQLKGLGRKPMLIRTDLTGKKLFIYGMNWKKNEGMYKLWDVENLTLLTEQTGPYIRFGEHISFPDGVHVIGDTAILNTEKKLLHHLWMGMYYGTPHVATLTPLPEWPYFAAIVCRDKTGIQSQLELWDVLERKRLGSIELARRADALAPLEKNKIAVLYSLNGRPLYDDKDDPAVSIYTFEKKATSDYPPQPEPGSYFFRIEIV